MGTHKPDNDIEIHSEHEEQGLVDEAGCSGGGEDFLFDEEGSLTLAAARTAVQPALTAQPILTLQRPCSLATLNGSWLLNLVPTGLHLPMPIRGPMRIETRSPRLRISGDVYVKPIRLVLAQPTIATAFIPGSLVIRKNWYPAFPQNEYRWYFRSLGVNYSSGKLIFRFERHLWSNASQSFTSTDNGWMELGCRTSLIQPIAAPQPTIEMKGTAMVGGTKYNVTATKTSPYYRGCLVEVDVMTNRKWPTSATSCGGGQTFTFTGVYRAAGLDFRAVVNELNVPEDPLLTISELHTLLATHRSLSAGGNNWHLWLLVGSRMDGTLGIMFDTGNPPHREGAVGFYDPTLPNSSIIHAPARGKKLGEVPLAFLRTLVHEAGHAFNLFHPKHDVHSVPVSTTIMNQTGDVMGFATSSNPYPCNATMGFNNHNSTSLIHSPDPQVKPSWKEFGWGHGSAWSGVAEPVDAIGLDEGVEDVSDLRLKADLPAEACLGEFVAATVTVTNTGSAPHDVTTELNLAEGDLRMKVTKPNGDTLDARDVVVVCGIRRMATLAPNESISGAVQLFYTPQGLTFDQPGRYEVRAELTVGDPEGSVLRSEPVVVTIRPAVTDAERECQRLTMDKGVGLSLALGDFGTDAAARKKLAAVMDKFGDTDTGAACAMVVANSLARELRDVRAARVVRRADEAEANRALDIAFKGRDAATASRLCAAVVSPRETAAPLVDMVQNRIRKARKGTYTDDDLKQATRIISDHLA